MKMIRSMSYRIRKVKMEVKLKLKEKEACGVEGRKEACK